MSKKLIDRIAREYRLANPSLDGAIVHAVNCGGLLREAKSKQPHGTWKAWLQQHWPASPRLANSYMQLSARVDKLPAGWESLTIDHALRLLRTRKRPSKPTRDEAEPQQQLPGEPVKDEKYYLQNLARAARDMSSSFKFLGSVLNPGARMTFTECSDRVREAFRSAHVTHCPGINRQQYDPEVNADKWEVIHQSTFHAGMITDPSFLGKKFIVRVAVEIQHESPARGSL